MANEELIREKEAEHARLERRMRELLRELRRTEAQADVWVELKWQTTCKAVDLSIPYKIEFIEFLEKTLAKEMKAAWATQ